MIFESGAFGEWDSLLCEGFGATVGKLENFALDKMANEIEASLVGSLVGSSRS